MTFADFFAASAKIAGLLFVVSSIPSIGFAAVMGAERVFLKFSELADEREQPAEFHARDLGAMLAKGFKSGPAPATAG
jgi:hypothetical protein